jgi:hypothetical protein
MGKLDFSKYSDERLTAYVLNGYTEYEARAIALQELLNRKQKTNKGNLFMELIHLNHTCTDALKIMQIVEQLEAGKPLSEVVVS